MNLGLVAIIITLLIIVGAVATRRCVECMIAGSMVAAVFLYGTGFLTGWSESLQNMLADNVWVMLVCLLFGGLISLLQYWFSSNMKETPHELAIITGDMLSGGLSMKSK